MTDKPESKYNNKPSKQLSRKRRIKKSDWRYVPYIPELLDTIHNHNPEDKMIAKIDGELIREKPTFDYHEVLEAYLPEAAAEVVDMHIGQGKTFQEIGDHLGTSRQYANQVYHKALKELRPHLTNLNLPTHKPLDNKVELNLFLRPTAITKKFIGDKE